jgi:CopG family transcriptional regulator / antitoxin EndoAI
MPFLRIQTSAQLAAERADGLPATATRAVPRIPPTLSPAPGQVAIHIRSGHSGGAKGGALVHKRINITLPEETVRLLDRLSTKGDRSGLIDRAIKSYVEEVGKANLRRRLKEGYERRAGHDLETAEAWFSIDEDAWSAGNR